MKTKDFIELNQKVSPLDMEGKKKTMSSFIFDEDQVLKIKNFTQSKLNNETFGYGLLLPKEIPILDKNKEVVGKEQVWSPVIINSKREIIEATKEIEILNKIKFRAIPTNLSLRWSLDSIKSFLEGDDKVPEPEPKEIFEKIRKKYEQNIFERDPVWHKVNALWDMDTYVYESFDAFPIREHRGLAGSGKTKKMRLSKNISFNATEILVNPSEATLFRETNDKKPTKYFDEAEKLFRYTKGNLEPDNRVELINASYSKGSYVPRVEKIGNSFVTMYYDCYSPTQISSIKGLFGATETRAITSVSTKNLDEDSRGEKEINDYDSDWQILRDSLYLFGLKYWKQIDENYKNDELYENLNIKKRDLQLWRPLLALAELIDHGLFLEVSAFAARLSTQRKEDTLPEDSFDYKILKIVREIIETSLIVRPKKVAEKFHLNHDGEKIGEKRFSTRLDNLGFKDLREPKDREGVKYVISKENFSIIVSPICPELVDYLSQSSQSSQSLINNKNNVMNTTNNVTNGDELDIEVIKISDEYNENDENDEK